MPTSQAHAGARIWPAANRVQRCRARLSTPRPSHPHSSHRRSATRPPDSSAHQFWRERLTHRRAQLSQERVPPCDKSWRIARSATFLATYSRQTTLSIRYQTLVLRLLHLRSSKTLSGLRRLLYNIAAASNTNCPRAELSPNLKTPPVKWLPIC